MAQPPAVVIIARHGPRLDAADQSWHLSTPTPYDPPLTYGGWNQSRALGMRIASLLHAREQAANEVSAAEHEGVMAHDFATQERQGGASASKGQNGRKRKRKHKVVIHTSPFLRCVQTSVAISAGMAQFQPPELANSRPSSSAKTGRSSSFRSPPITPMVEHGQDFAHAMARRSFGQSKRHRKSKLRVDSFLGEWLNPQYFEKITPPPPSAMMVATAKAELMQNETVDVFTPSMPTKPTNHSLWGGGGAQKKGHRRESSVDDSSGIQDAPQTTPPSPRRDRTSSFGGSDSSPGKRSSLRPSMHGRRPSNLPKPETSVYVPPTPQYAVSSSDRIPKGYMSHAREACANVDSHWDSSRSPQDWGDGGELGEEWSQMHKRFRRGLNHLVHWYSQHNADDRAEDSLCFDQAERHEDEEQEDLVVVLVTHGAGANALIGALTGQPVLLDVGMASLTMAVRKDDAPEVATNASSTASSKEPSPVANTHETNGSGHNQPRRGSLDVGLGSLYEMKLVSSSEHLRPGADPSKTSLTNASNPKAGSATSYRQRLATVSLGEPPSAFGSRPNSSLGSVRRPSVSNTAASVSPPKHAIPPGAQHLDNVPESAPVSPGLWTPPAAGTPRLAAAKAAAEEAKIAELSKLDEERGRKGSANTEAPVADGSKPVKTDPATSRETPQVTQATRSMALALNGSLVNSPPDTAVSSRSPSTSPPPTAEQARVSERQVRGSIPDVPAVGEQPPVTLGRTMSQKGLWGSRPAGDKVKRSWGEPKRRWTVTQEEGQR
ncbi:hypothetical protein D0860_05808 [Hortaea werneckii]|uniref:Phosphoglycerate mutase n=1 Tax=Hortaea werneckii TaxID=91943 RepID=A0A3M7GXU4_HORWE|nr:hypothetical protein D0860_05808 [Hortaea werneckii]